MMQPLRLVPLAFLAALAACAAPGGEYPSLAIRDVERVSGTMQVPPAPPPQPPAAATLGQMDALAATARSAHAGFLAALPQARSLVSSAAGASEGSENWARAQVAIADLEAQRSQAMIALADLDRLYVDAATSNTETGPIADVRGEIDALVTEQNAAIRALLATLAG